MIEEEREAMNAEQEVVEEINEAWNEFLMRTRRRR